MSSPRFLGKFALGLSLGVALTVAATQAWSVTAAPGDTDSTYVPVAPCRLLDTRPGLPPLGGTKTPIGPGTANAITQQVTGNVGNCVGIPSDAVAIAANVTVVGPTAQSNLRLYPANESVPTASNLNWVAGQAPTPNLVTVKLSPDGKIKVFNQNGTVNVIVDIAGYYTPSSLAELNQRLAAVEAGGGGGSGGVIVEYASATDVPPTMNESAVVGGQIAATEQLTVTLQAPTAGKISVIAHATAKSGATPRARLVCQITNNPASTSIDVNEVLGIAAPSSGGAQPSLGTNRVFDVVAGSNTFDLMCAATGNQGDEINDSVEIHYRSMTALFTPTA
jgi:hypothetical protein